MKTQNLIAVLLFCLSTSLAAFAGSDNLCYLSSNLAQGDDGSAGCWIILSSDINPYVTSFVYDCKLNGRTDAQAVEVAELQAAEQNRIAGPEYAEEVRERSIAIHGYKTELNSYNSAMQSCLNAGFSQQSCNFQLKDFDHSHQEYGVPDAPQMRALPLPEESVVDPHDPTFMTDISMTENVRDRAVKLQEAKVYSRNLVNSGYCAAVINRTGW